MLLAPDLRNGEEWGDVLVSIYQTDVTSFYPNSL